MNALLKIPRSLLSIALADLERPHPYAAERVGFLSFRQSTHRNKPILLCYDYHSISDSHYMHDGSCGARIGGEAIRHAMGRAFRDQSGQLWIHAHARRGCPAASRIDLQEGPKVAQSVLNAQPKAFQGWSVISENGICGQVLAMDGTVYEMADLSVVGWPMVTPSRPSPKALRRNTVRLFFAPRPLEKRYDRQSFLGPDSQRIIESAKVGIVGLGGGGSHVTQQLAHIGFQRIVLCDNDRIDSTNLNRLIGATLRDVPRMKHKTAVASRLFKQLQPDAEIDDRPLVWEDKRDALRDCDIIFGCMDSFSGRRDLEAFCRSVMIPVVDIGMRVDRPVDGGLPNIFGQAILSMPGEPCMHCLQVLTAGNLAEEAQGYGAGRQPQVVWPNGVLAATGVGYAVQLLTGWAAGISGYRVDYRGNQLTLAESNLAAELKRSAVRCKHYPLSKSGDPIWRPM